MKTVSRDDANFDGLYGVTAGSYENLRCHQCVLVPQIIETNS